MLVLLTGLVIVLLLHFVWPAFMRSEINEQPEDGGDGLSFADHFDTSSIWQAVMDLAHKVACDLTKRLFTSTMRRHGVKAGNIG